jgi:carbon-monoxide dehydrogenase medium subunit
VKPAPFLYFAPRSVEEALALLAEHGDDAKVLAGGQSLVPTMNFRLAQPTVLVDLNRVEGISEIGTAGDGGVCIGAMVRQRHVETSSLVARDAPLVHSTMPFIAHPQIRNRGTFGGSLAHADPAAELPAVCLALGARFRVRSQGGGERSLEAEEFFTGLFSTDLGPDELLVEVHLPPPSVRSGWSFQEVSRRHGDYALVGVAVTVTLSAAGRCEAAKIVLLSVGEGPVEARSATELLVGEELGKGAFEAAAAAVASEIDPPSDIHASSDFRRHLAAVLTRRTLAEAAGRAG